MKRRTRISIAGVVVALAFFAGARRAEANYPSAALSWSHAQMNGGARYGSDNLNLGFGARGGYTLPNGVYIGGLFDWFIGESQTLVMGGTSVSASAHEWNIGAEGGFDFALDERLMIRPFIGLGIANASGEVCIDQVGGPQCTSVSADDSFIEFGGLLNYLTGSMMVGGDLRVIIPDNSWLVIGGHIGWLF